MNSSPSEMAAAAATLLVVVPAKPWRAKHRLAALRTLDALVREGEYLPLALTFLATQFRLAMVAHEAGLRNAQQIQAHFTKQGIRMWRDRAEQVNQTVAAFPGEKLARAIDEEGRFEALAVLADALEEAGCDCTALLDHCRSHGPHVRGCWALDLLLARSATP